MGIIEFLEARIDEDEARAGSGWTSLRDARWETDNYGRNFLTPSAVLAECAAKRAIVGLHEYEWMGPDDAAGKGCALDYEAWPCSTVRHLATVYKDHPDYQQEWARG